MTVEVAEVLEFPEVNCTTKPARVPRAKTASAEQVIETWYREGDAETLGHSEKEEHLPFWVTMIKGIQEQSLSGATILDFGCSRGGFLDALFEIHPFRFGRGLDISKEAIETAREMPRAYPAEFHLADESGIPSASINYAFSYEVIWLLKDIAQHAAFMRRVLADNGVYYAATGCHTAHPRWSEWKEIIQRRTTLPPADHSPEDFARAFKAAGFKVSARQLGHQDFVPIGDYEDYFPTVKDTIDYYAKQILVFRFEKQP